MSEIKGCSSRKVAYASRAEARTTVRRTDSPVAGSSRPYLCGECGMWHLGRKMKSKAKTSRRRYLEGKFPDERRLEST